MSRVDEAMRRAAEQATGAAASGHAPAPLAIDAGDVETLSREPFPIEMPDRRGVRATPAIVTVATVPDVKAAPDVKVAPEVRPAPDVKASAHAPAASKSKWSSLLERFDTRLAAKVVTDQTTMPASREQYRRLAASLHHAQAATGLKVIMVTSAVAGEGKTLTSSNLALTFSESYKRSVLLIDADLRRPTIHSFFQIDNESGLGEGLSSAHERKFPVRQVSPYLNVLPAGSPSSDPMAGLTSSRMDRLIAEAREVFDWVILDTPPIAVLPDAHLLMAMIDGAVVVVKAGSTSYDLVRRAVETIGRAKTLGVVLNRATADTSRTGYGYDSYYGGGYGYYYGVREQGPKPV